MPASDSDLLLWLDIEVTACQEDLRFSALRAARHSQSQRSLYDKRTHLLRHTEKCE